MNISIISRRDRVRQTTDWADEMTIDQLKISLEQERQARLRGQFDLGDGTWLIARDDRGDGLELALHQGVPTGTIVGCIRIPKTAMRGVWTWLAAMIQERSRR